MKKRVLAGILSVILSAGMMTGTFFTADGTDHVQAAEENQISTPESCTWDLTVNSGLPLVEGGKGEFDGIQIDATTGKFSFRTEYNDTQINAGTVLTIPVEANSDGAVLTFTLSGGSATLAVGEEEYATVEGSKVVTIELKPSGTATKCAVSFVTQAYLSSIELTYSEPAAEYPGTPDSAAAEDVTTRCRAWTVCWMRAETQRRITNLKVTEELSGI